MRRTKHCWNHYSPSSSPRAARRAVLLSLSLALTPTPILLETPYTPHPSSILTPLIPKSRAPLPSRAPVSHPAPSHDGSFPPVAAPSHSTRQLSRCSVSLPPPRELVVHALLQTVNMSSRQPPSLSTRIRYFFFFFSTEFHPPPPPPLFSREKKKPRALFFSRDRTRTKEERYMIRRDAGQARADRRCRRLKQT